MIVDLLEGNPEIPLDTMEIIYCIGFRVCAKLWFTKTYDCYNIHLELYNKQMHFVRHYKALVSNLKPLFKSRKIFAYIDKCNTTALYFALKSGFLPVEFSGARICMYWSDFK